MTSGRRWGRPGARPRPTAVAVAALGTVAVLAAGLLVGPATASSAATDPGSTVGLSLTSIEPSSPAAGDNVVVQGIATNMGTDPLDHLAVQLRVSDTPVGSRDELASIAGSSDRPPGNAVDGAAVHQDTPLTAGASVPFTLTAHARDLPLTAPGVYALAVEAIADDLSGNGDRTRYGTVRTFLPYDMAAVAPTRVGLLWPLLGTPSRDADGVPVDQVLHDQITGRLGAELEAASGARVTWLVDGDTLESAAQLAAGAPTTGGAHAATAPPDPVAAAWLTALAQATVAGQVEALAYADPDLVATQRAGLAGDLVQSAQLGPQVAQQVLGRGTPVGSGLAWPADGTTDAPTITALARTVTRQLLLSDAFTPPVRDVTWTPSAVGPLTGTHFTAVVSDATLSAELVAPPSGPGGPAAARQRLLAELAMVGLELPTVSRSVVLVAPRSWTPDVPYVRALMATLASTPWVRLATLAELSVGSSDGPARQRPTYPLSARQRELDGVQLAAVRDGHRSLAGLSGVLTQPQQPLVGTFGRGLLRGESAAWRVDRDAGKAYAGSTTARINQVRDEVHVVPPGAVTLAARSGRIPVTVSNGLDQPVTVQVGVAVVPAARLTVTAPAQPFTVPAHGTTTMDLAAEATANGGAQLTVQLLSPDGAPYGQVSTVDVEITGLGAVAQLLVLVAVVLLAGALGLRVVRAVRAGRRRPGSPASVRERVG